jgi:4-hydroxybenzoate polyprenyltransferase
VRFANSKALALIRSSHPIPCLSVALFSGLLAIGLGLPEERAGLIFVAVLLQQISVGLSNDWIDFQRDVAANRTDKPTVSGLVKVSWLRNGSLFAIALAIVTSLAMGSSAVLVMLLMLLAGWSYNLGMKLNWLSPIPYAVGFGAIPIFVGMAATEPFWVEPWIVMAAALLGVSAHFANVLPDMQADKLTGVRALPHLMGQRLSAVVISLSALFATLLVVTQSRNLSAEVAAAGLAATVLLVGIASLLSLRKQPPRTAFLLLILASLVNVILLMLGA